MTAGAAARRRALAFARRAWIQQGPFAVGLAALIGALLGVIVLVGPSGMSATTDLSAVIPADPLGLAAVRDATGALAPMSSYLVTMSPAMLGMLVALIATLTLPGVVADDISSGGIEVLLASPVPRRRLFWAYLSAALLLTSASWVVALLAFTLAALIASAILNVTVTLSLGYVVAMALVPLALGVWSATATLYGALLHPHSLESRAGMNGGPIRLVALLPAMVVVPSVLLVPTWVIPMLAATLVVSLVASSLLVRHTARGFRSARVLGS